MASVNTGCLPKRKWIGKSLEWPLPNFKGPLTIRGNFLYFFKSGVLDPRLGLFHHTIFWKIISSDGSSQQNAYQLAVLQQLITDNCQVGDRRLGDDPLDEDDRSCPVILLSENTSVFITEQENIDLNFSMMACLHRFQFNEEI
jgi:hypothetical protein